MNKLYIRIAVIIAMYVVCTFAKTTRVLAEIECEFKDTASSAPSGVIKMQKILKDGKIETICVSHPGDSITMADIRIFRKEETRAINNHFGAISGDLRYHLKYLGDNDTIEITAKLNTAVSEELLNELLIDHNDVRSCYTCNMDTLKMVVTKTKLFQLSKDDRFENIISESLSKPQSGGDENCEECTDVTTQTPMWIVENIMNLPQGVKLSDLPSWYFGKSDDGTAINCATFEKGVYPDYLGLLHAQFPKATLGRIDPRPTGYYHSDGTFGCMARIASQGRWNHITDSNPNYPDMLKDSIQTCSKSHGGYQGVLSESQREYDSWVYKPDLRPLIFGPASNDGIHFTTSWSYYNHISVGGALLQRGEGLGDEYFEINEIRTSYADSFYNEATKEWENQDSTLTSSVGSPSILTQTVNFLDTGLAVKTDRETPHLVSMSTAYCKGVPDDIQMALEYKKKFGTLWYIGGTSAAAPFTNGLATAVISANPTRMKNQPTNTKAALMVTAINIDGGYWNPLEDGRDGCGVVSGYDAVTFIHDSCTFFDSTSDKSIAKTHGLAYGTIKNVANNSDKITYQFKAPTNLTNFKKRHFRAVLSWTSSVSASDSINELSDLDLILRDNVTGEIVDLCASIDDNSEVIDVELKDLVPSRTYSLEVLIDTLVFPAGCDNDHIKYALAWTFPQDYRGKRIMEADTVDGVWDYSLLNRNLNVGPLKLKERSKVSVRATNQIVLEQGTVLDSGSNFTAEIVSPLFSFWSHLNAGYNQIDTLDRTGNNRGASKNNVGFVRRKLYSQEGWYFDGSTSSINIKQPTGDTIDFKNGLSVVAEVSVSDLQTGGTIFSVNDEKGGSAAFKLVGNKLVFSFAAPSGDRKAVSCDIPQSIIDTVMGFPTRYELFKPLPAWAVVGVSWNRGESVRFYTNFKMLKPFDVSSNGLPINATNGSMKIGSNSSNESFDGSISDIMVFNGPLSDTAIAGLHRSSDWPKYRGSFYDGKVTILGNGKVRLKELELDDYHKVDETIEGNGDSTKSVFTFVNYSTYEIFPDTNYVLDSVKFYAYDTNPIVKKYVWKHDIVSKPSFILKKHKYSTVNDRREWKFYFRK